MRRLACFFTMLMFAQLSPAAELNWPGRPFNIMASEKPLPDLLRELAASQGTTAVVDPKIAGTISGKFSAAPLNILNSLCATYALSWYYDGALLYIDPSSEVRTEVMSIGGGQGNAEWLVHSLMQLHIYDKRYPLMVSGRDGTVRVTGPKRYVELVRQATRLMDRKNAQNDGAEIRMFPLKYAWAGDFRIARSGREVSIPGVANTLRALYGRNTPTRATGNSTVALRRPNSTYGMGADRQMRLSSGDVVSAPKVDLAAMAGGPIEDDDASGGLVPFTGELPQFQADTRSNAVIIRDLPGRMAQYEKLIAAMDSKPRLVEIEVTIMDISNDTLDSLGVDLRAHTSHFDLQTGNGSNAPLNYGGANSESGQFSGLGLAALATPVGSLITASIGNSVRNYLLARVSALAQRGDANFVARPKVLTLDNSEAILENLSDFYVRVNGFQDAGLFKVTTGTSVRVTPLIVDEQSGRGMMMSINIEDGDISSTSFVDQIPIVLHRTVNTQAMIAEGTSLLIAGYTSESKSKATAGVPVLSDIPVLGHLFKYDEKKQNRQERFYLLTPRLVLPTTLASAAGIAPMPVQQEPLPPRSAAPNAGAFSTPGMPPSGR